VRGERGREDCDCEEVKEAKSSVVRQHSERERGVNVKHYRRHDDDVVVLGHHREHFNHPAFCP
jgi:hypothetical protein